MTTVRSDSSNETAEQRREREAAQETVGAAMRAAVVWGAIGPIVCIVTLWLLRKSIVSAQELISDKAEFPHEPFMPVLLLVGAAACSAAFVTWRITQVSGAVGGPVLMSGGVCVAATILACAIASFVIFTAGVPALVWASLAIMAGVGLGAVWVVSHISG